MKSSKVISIPTAQMALGRGFVSSFAPQGSYSLIQSQVPNEVCWWLFKSKQTNPGTQKKGFFSAWKATETDWGGHGKTAIVAMSYSQQHNSRMTWGLFCNQFWLVPSSILHPAKQSPPPVVVERCVWFWLTKDNCTSIYCSSGTGSDSHAQRSSLTAVLVRAALTSGANEWPLASSPDSQHPQAFPEAWSPPGGP